MWSETLGAITTSPRPIKYGLKPPNYLQLVRYCPTVKCDVINYLAFNKPTFLRSAMHVYFYFFMFHFGVLLYDIHFHNNSLIIIIIIIILRPP